MLRTLEDEPIEFESWIASEWKYNTISSYYKETYNHPPTSSYVPVRGNILYLFGLKQQMEKRNKIKRKVIPWEKE